MLRTKPLQTIRHSLQQTTSVSQFSLPPDIPKQRHPRDKVLSWYSILFLGGCWRTSSLGILIKVSCCKPRFTCELTHLFLRGWRIIRWIMGKNQFSTVRPSMPAKRVSSRSLRGTYNAGVLPFTSPHNCLRILASSHNVMVGDGLLYWRMWQKSARLQHLSDRPHGTFDYAAYMILESEETTHLPSQ